MVHKYLRVDNLLFWLPRPLFPLPFPLKKKKKSKETGPISIPGLHLLKTCDVLPQRVRADVGPWVWMRTETTQQ